MWPCFAVSVISLRWSTSQPRSRSSCSSCCWFVAWHCQALQRVSSSTCTRTLLAWRTQRLVPLLIFSDISSRLRSILLCSSLTKHCYAGSLWICIGYWLATVSICAVGSLELLCTSVMLLCSPSSSGLSLSLPALSSHFAGVDWRWHPDLLFLRHLFGRHDFLGELQQVQIQLLQVRC